MKERTEAQLEAMRKNAVKARKALAAKRKAGLLKPAKHKTKMVKTEIPLDLIPMGPAPVVKKAKPKVRDEALPVEALGELIAAVFVALQRKRT